jgi:hypothetical protein
MSRVLFFALISATLSVIAYVFLAIRNKKLPELADGIQIFVGVVGLFGAFRLTGFAFSGQFSLLVKQSPKNTVFSFSEDDVTLIVVGGIAVAWVSIQTIIASYRKIS